MPWLRNILSPAGFHGRNTGSPFFEGWYIKLITADGEGLALIPGIFRGRSPGSAHAFVQILINHRQSAIYHRFPIESFSGKEDRFEIAIGEHHFGTDGLDIHTDTCQGSVQFGPLNPWPVSLISPGAMGWYAWAPFMQCYHGIVSFHHPLEGYLVVRNKRYNFSGGRGYIEKDWGRSFPSNWIWMQSHSFADDEVCVSLSLASVPWLGYTFPGLLAGVWLNGTLIPMTSYTGARLESINAGSNSVRLVIYDRSYRLEVTAEGGSATSVHIPSTTSMDHTVQEHMPGNLYTRLVDHLGHTVYNGTGRQAAYEIHGDINKLSSRLPSRRSRL
ncbi:MAG: hypothetical protein KTR25_08630 [Myxococcales bacterium]|nr:hypothetical protein [Myxococcales bacterium]